MIALTEATERVLAGASPLEPVVVALGEANGTVLRTDVVAAYDTPPFDASAMDGYAVRSADLVELPRRLAVIGTSSCGHPSDAVVAEGAAVRILTGAVVPDGADCVVPVERTDGGTGEVVVNSGVRPGSAVRRRGEVARAGEALVLAGTRLTAGHLGVAAGEGLDRLEVTRSPRVAVVSTGDELVRPGGGELGPGQIYDSNSTLMGQLAASAGCEVQVCSAADDPIALRELLEGLAAHADVILTSGGVSMGAEFDPLRAALAAHPVEFWQVAIKPAKPLAFGGIGSTVGPAVYVGLPGNPNAVVVSFELFVRPLLERLSGLDVAGPRYIEGVAGSPFELSVDDRSHLLPVRRTPAGTWQRCDVAGSHALPGLASADALALFTAGASDVAAGGALQLLPLWI